MKVKRLGLLIGLLGLFAIAVATMMAVAQPSAQSAALAKAALDKKEAVLVFSYAIGDPDFDLAAGGDPDFDLAAIVEAIRTGAKIGSTDPDGFGVDSFFDIEYEIDYLTGTGAVDVEIHAVPNSPDVDPVTVIENVRIKLAGLKLRSHELTGHVTLVK